MHWALARIHEINSRAISSQYSDFQGCNAVVMSESRACFIFRSHFNLEDDAHKTSGT